MHARTPMTFSIQIAKFKFHQYQLKAVSPNLMPVKVTCYTVFQEGVVIIFEPTVTISH